MLTYELKIDFAGSRGYIADPYWPEIYQLINVTKESGMNRAKSAANRRKALEEWLRANGKTLEWYEELEASTKRPFYTDAGGQIIIPPEQFMSFLVQACKTARAAQRAVPPDQVWARIKASAFTTGKVKEDGVWSRFATVSAGTGQKLSNQRGLRESKFITDFVATGTVTFDPETVDPKSLWNMIKWAGAMCGIGASRPMGWGRFELVSTKELKRPKLVAAE
jgi:hypothetical protein